MVAVGSDRAHHERGSVPSITLRAVEPETADADDASAVANVGRNGRMLGQRRDVISDEIGAGRVRSVRRSRPAARREQRRAHGIDVVAPRREHANVRPLEHRRARSVSRLEHDKVLAATGQVGGGREPHRAGSNDEDRQGLHLIHHLTHSVSVRRPVCDLPLRLIFGNQSLDDHHIEPAAIQPRVSQIRAYLPKVTRTA